MTENIDMEISGIGSMPGGEYRDVDISGAGRIEGNLRCRSLDISGSGKVAGDVFCTGEVDSSGAGKITGSLEAESLDCSGAFTCEGGCTLHGKLDASGATKILGSLRPDQIDVSGTLHCGGDVSAEKFEGACACRIDGLLNAETIELELEGNCRIGDLGGANIRVKSGARWHLMKHQYGVLETGTIEGDAIELEYTHADTVRGSSVAIGPGCRVRRVEYTESLFVDPNAEVGEKVKIGG